MTTEERGYTVTNGRRYAIGDSQRGTATPRIQGALTPWQLQVLRTVADGLTQEEAGAQLFLSPSTIKTHRRNIIRQLGARNCAHAVAIAYQRGLLP